MEVTDANFETEVIEKSKQLPVLVDFWASWCGPCQMLTPIIEKLAKEYAGKIEIVKLNVEENQSTAGKYLVMSIPNIKLFKDGEVADELVGFNPEAAMKEWINSKI